jgi:putative transposase
MYLTAIIDWHSRYIVGWALSDTLDTAPVLDGMKKAIEQYGIPGIVNSDYTEEKAMPKNLYDSEYRCIA